MLRKDLNTASLVELLGVEFDKIKDELKNSKFSISDCLKSGLAIYGMKVSSLLQFDELTRANPDPVIHNIQKLYQVKEVPSDTYFRERLDSIDEVHRLQYGMDKIIARLQSGKVLVDYKYIEDSYLVAIDGTGYFSSNKVHCKNCCQKNHRDGKITYHHNMLSAVMVHPEIKHVFPLALESMQKQDGIKKNDCERNACRRLLHKLKTAHPKIKLTIVLDALYADALTISLIQDLGWHYIIVAKNLKSLFDEFNYGGKQQIVEYKNATTVNSYTFASSLSLNETNSTIKTNVLKYASANRVKTKASTYNNTWITDLSLTKGSVALVAKAGRARWHIENQTFNTLKNQGYNFEHNFGHGKNNLSTIMAYLMFLAFLIDQIQEATNKEFQSVLKKMKRKLYLWNKISFIFIQFFLDSWDDLYELIENKNGRYNKYFTLCEIRKLFNSST